MSTDIIDTSLHTDAFPATYIGSGTLLGHCRQSSSIQSDLFGWFTSDGNAVQVNVGARPLEVLIVNDTDGIVWHWTYGMAATHAFKEVFGGSPTSTVDTTSAIVVSEPAAYSGGNWIVTLSAALAGTGKTICFKVIA